MTIYKTRQERDLGRMQEDHSLRGRHAGLLFIVAKEAAKRAHSSSGTLGEQLEVMTTIVLSVVVAEAGINEIAHWYRFHHQRPPFSIDRTLSSAFEGRRLREKWRQLPQLIRDRHFEEQDDPWKSFDTLIELRNAIVHLRSEPLADKAVRVLREKNLPVNFLTFSVACWACNTIAAMFDELTRLIEPPPHWINLSWLWTPTHSCPYGLSTPGRPWPEDRRRN